MRILTVTTSARGHAIVDALCRSAHVPEIVAVCAQRNPGIRKMSAEFHAHSVMDFPFILDVAKRAKVEFAIIGPEDPIGGGLADLLEAQGIGVIAPKRLLARIESSKRFARDLLEKHSIDASPRYRAFTKDDQRDIHAFMEELGGEYVVKYDGLIGGKGVKLSGEHLATIDDGVSYAEECIEQGGQVVIEEKLIGVEFSLMSFVSGKSVVSMPAIQDHKRAFEGDNGPNTGGMGTYSDANHSLPFLEKSDLDAAQEINQRVAEALMTECNEPYRGILYGGFIAVRNGVRVIEYNARFGDPESLNVLPLLESDFVDLCRGIIHGDLTDDMVRFAPRATVCKYITPEGYPVRKDKQGSKIVLPPEEAGARIYIGDLTEDEQGALHLGGSRSAGIVGIGATIAEAEAKAEALCCAVKGPVAYRKDIGTAALIDKRIAMMKKLRGR